MLQCKIISVGFWEVMLAGRGQFRYYTQGYPQTKAIICIWQSTLFFARLLAKGADESPLAGELRWSRSVLIMMIFWLLGIPGVLTQSDL